MAKMTIISYLQPTLWHFSLILWHSWGEVLDYMHLRHHFAVLVGGGGLGEYGY